MRVKRKPSEPILHLTMTKDEAKSLYGFLSACTIQDIDSIKPGSAGIVFMLCGELDRAFENLHSLSLVSGTPSNS
jgi:hypothetical protein